MHLQAEASVLEAEAATWTLLLHMYARTNKTYPGGRGGQQTSVPTVSLALTALLTLSKAICTHTHAAGKGLLAGAVAAGCVLCLTIDTNDAFYVVLPVVNPHPTKCCASLACWCQVYAASMCFHNFAAHSEYAVCCRSIIQLQASSQMMQNYFSVRV